EALPAGTPVRMGVLVDKNAGKVFVMLREKLTLPSKLVVRKWVMPEHVTNVTGEEITRLEYDTAILDQFRELLVDSWYIKHLVTIGPHTRDMAEAIKAEKLDELRRIDPVIENAKEIWQGVLPRLHITITGENSDIADNVQDLISLVQLEQ